MKRTLIVDHHGVPLAFRTARADASDHRKLLPLVLDFPRVGGETGRPKDLPDEAYADRWYESEATRAVLRRPEIEPNYPKRKWHQQDIPSPVQPLHDS